MDTRDMLFKAVENMGYKPNLDSDGDIVFTYQMKPIYILIGNMDEPYVQVQLPQFFDIEEEQEALVLAICNKMTRELKILKVYIDQTFKHVTADYEFLYTDEESLAQNLDSAISRLGIVRRAFRNTLNEMSQ